MSKEVGAYMSTLSISCVQICLKVLSVRGLCDPIRVSICEANIKFISCLILADKLEAPVIRDLLRKQISVRCIQLNNWAWRISSY
jgi:hypothetical protein